MIQARDGTIEVRSSLTPNPLDWFGAAVLFLVFTLLVVLASYGLVEVLHDRFEVRPMSTSVPAGDERARLVQLLARCHADPDLFNSAVLGRPAYWWRQVEMSRAVARYYAVAVESGNAVGKDYWVGGLVPWWLWTRHNSLVIVTGPGQTVIGSVTWKEIRRAVDGARFKMGARISAGIKTSPHTVDLGNGWGALGFSTTSVERASGQHAGQLLVIVEEASGVEPEVWEAIRSLKPTKIVAIGNPIRPDGGFAELVDQAAEDERKNVPDHLRTYALNIPSTDSPHAELDHSPYGLADRTWLETNYAFYGRNSLWVRTHILAIRPKLSHDTLIPPAHLDYATLEAHLGLRRIVPGGRTRMACDVGEGVGNARSVVIVGDDLGVREIAGDEFKGPGETAEVMGQLAERHKIPAERLSYDGAGQTGKRLGNALARLGLSAARPYFGSSGGGKRAKNLRTACAMALARRLDPEHCPDLAHPKTPQHPYYIPHGPHWAAMREELAALRYTLDGDKSVLESKEDMMDRLGRSPDYADCLAQLFREEAIRG
jgi:hypothetical protein